jgi:guanylate kinase
LKKFPDFIYSISYTTRPPRGNEKNGKDYFFIEKEAFEKKLKQDYWAEWANVHGYFYGTSREFLDNYLIPRPEYSAGYRCSGNPADS